MMDVSAKTQAPTIKLKRKRSLASELKMLDFQRNVSDYEPMVASFNARFHYAHQSCRA